MKNERIHRSYALFVVLICFLGIFFWTMQDSNAAQTSIERPRREIPLNKALSKLLPAPKTVVEQENIGNKYRIAMTDVEFVKKRDIITKLFTTYPNLVAVLDVGGKFVSKKGVLTLTKKEFNPAIHHLIITNHKNNVKRIGAFFLAECRSLLSLTLYPLINLTSINGYFLAECTKLKTLNLGCLHSVESIGHSFLANCRALMHLDLKPLQNVRKIGQLFLSGCGHLKDVDFTQLHKVKRVTHPKPNTSGFEVIKD